MAPTDKSAMGHLQFIRQMNRTLILREIRSSQPISRGQLADRLGLGKSTVSTIVDDLVAQRLVLNLGERPANGSGGRPAPLFGFNPRSAFGVGLDIGGTKIQVLVTDMDGVAVAERKVPTTNSVEEIAALTRSVLAEAGVDEASVLGMGIGVPGTVADTTVVRAKALSWTNFDLISALRSEFAFPLFLGNDVNNAALGERWLGAAEGRDDLVFFSLGTGIGAAVVVAGEVVYGADGRAGEVAYNVNRADLDSGNLNVLGKPGVLEQRVSGYALMSKGEDPKQLFDAYSRGDGSAVDLIDDMIAELSVTICNVVNLLNPSTVVLGGGLAESMQVVLPRIRELVSGLTPVRTNIRLSSLGALAGAYGAVALAFSRIELGVLGPDPKEAAR